MDAEPGLRSLPATPGTSLPSRSGPVRRRAADAGLGPSPREQPGISLAGRAHRRTGAAARPGVRPHRSATQEGRPVHAPGGAEPRLRPQAGRLRLCHEQGPYRLRIAARTPRAQRRGEGPSPRRFVTGDEALATLLAVRGCHVRGPGLIEAALVLLGDPV